MQTQGMLAEEGQRLLKRLLGCAPSAIAALDSEDTLVLVNPHYATLARYDGDEVVGRLHLNLLASNNHPDIQEAFTKTMGEAAEISGCGAKLLLRHGSTRIVRFSLIPGLLLGKTTSAVWTADGITGASLAEQMLWENQERFRRIVENDHDIIWILSGDTAGVVSAALETLTGRRCEDLYSRFRSSIDIIHPEDRLSAVAGLAAQMRGVSGHGAEFRVVRIDGAFRSVRTTAFAIRNRADEMSRFAGLNQDITVAKRAERALRQSRDLYRDLVENSGVLMGTHDEEGRIVSVNQAVVELAGLQTAEQMVGRKISDFLTLETRDLFSSYLETVLQQGRAQGLMRVQTGTGQERILEYKNSLRREGLDRPIVRCIGHDVTDQKRAERAVHESEARYRLVAENSQDLIALIEPAGKILYASPSHFHVLGYSPDDLIHNSILRLVHSEDAGSVCRLAQDLVRSGGAGTIELRLKKVNADWLQFEAIVSAIADANGTVSRLLVSARNITERRRAEESLHRVSGRLIQLQDEERRHIARELHDSTAQSLAALAMNLQAANDSAVEFSPHVRNALSESASLVSHCLREIRTLSYLLHPPQPDDFGFASALRHYAAGFARRSGIEVKLDVPSELPRLSQPLEVTLFRILQESLSNIHRHSGSSTADVRVELTRHQIKLEVRDKGRGIPAPILERINESFADLGVGIAGMRERVSQLCGTLEVQSDGHGTNVCASLPVQSSVNNPR